MCSLSYCPVDSGPWERHGASRYHLSEQNNPSWSTATPRSYRYCAPVLHHQHAAYTDGRCLPRSTKTHHGRLLLPTPSTHPLSCTTSCLTHCGVAGGVSDAAGVCCPRPKVPAHATSVATLKGNNPFSPPAAAGEGPHTSKGRVLPPNPPIICRSR